MILGRRSRKPTAIGYWPTTVGLGLGLTNSVFSFHHLQNLVELALNS